MRAEGEEAIVNEIIAFNSRDKDAFGWCDSDWMRYFKDRAAGKHNLPPGAASLDEGHSGMTLADFTKHPLSVAAGLDKAMILALRLFSSSVHVNINKYLRLGCSVEHPHPYPAIVINLMEAFSQLRNTKEPEGGWPTTTSDGPVIDQPLRDTKVRRSLIARGSSTQALAVGAAAAAAAGSVEAAGGVGAKPGGGSRPASPEPARASKSAGASPKPARASKRASADDLAGSDSDDDEAADEAASPAAAPEAVGATAPADAPAEQAPPEEKPTGVFEEPGIRYCCMRSEGVDIAENSPLAVRCMTEMGFLSVTPSREIAFERARRTKPPALVVRLNVGESREGGAQGAKVATFSLNRSDHEIVYLPGTFMQYESHSWIQAEDGQGAPICVLEVAPQLA